MKTALIAGSTGLVGSELLNQLIDEPTYTKIHLLVRKEVHHDSPKVVCHIIDFDTLSEFNPGTIIHDAFCTLGTTIKKAGTKENFKKVDYQYVLALGEKAKSLNVEKFLMVSSLGANHKSKIFYNNVKGAIEKSLSTLGLNQLFIFRPSLLMGERKEHRSAEKTAIQIYKIINPLFIGKLKKYKGIQAKQVAKAMMITALQSKNNFKIFESDEIQEF